MRVPEGTGGAEKWESQQRGGGTLGKGESWKGQEGLGVRVPEGTVPGDEHPKMGQERLKERIPGEKKDPELEN